MKHLIYIVLFLASCQTEEPILKKSIYDEKGTTVQREIKEMPNYLSKTVDSLVILSTQNQSIGIIMFELIENDYYNNNICKVDIYITTQDTLLPPLIEIRYWTTHMSKEYMVEMKKREDPEYWPQLGMTLDEYMESKSKNN